MADPIVLFISYAENDRNWAQWIATQLDVAGYTVELHESDPDPSSWRSVAEALTSAKYVIVVLSSSYMKSTSVEFEWDVLIQEHEHRLIAVRVENFASPAHLAGGRLVDIAGLETRDAAHKLLVGVRRNIEGYDVSTGDGIERAQPTPRLTSDTWTVIDSLGFDVYVDALTSFLRHADTRPPLTIGIKGKWGSGKTSLMRMLRDKLDPMDGLTGKRGDIRLSRHSSELLAETAPLSWRARLLALCSHLLFVLPGMGKHRTHTARIPVGESVTIGEVVNQTNEPTSHKQRRLEKLEVEPPPSGSVHVNESDYWRPTVWFNPWICQSEEQVWAGLANEIITQITDRMTVIEKERFWLTLNLRRVDGAEIRRRVTRLIVERLLPLGLLLIPLVVLTFGVLISGATTSASVMASTGAAIAAIGGVWRTSTLFKEDASIAFQSLLEPNYGKKSESTPSSSVPNVLDTALRDPGYKSRLGFLHMVQEDMRCVLDLACTGTRPLIIFVDDLDRCSPSIVAQVMQALNLFVAGTFPNSIFILAMDPAVVAAHIESAYADLASRIEKDGDNESEPLGWLFLEKIVQLPLSLPAHPEHGQMEKYLDSLLTKGTGEVVPKEPVSETLTAKPMTETRSQSEGAALISRHGAVGSENDYVDRVTRLLRKGKPTIGQIWQEAIKIQGKLLPDLSSGTFHPSTAIGARRVFSELFNDDWPEVRLVISTGVRRLQSTNPRQIKRYINLFRFYAFIAAEREYHGGRVVDLDQVAKLAALAIRWPHAMDMLGNAAPDGQLWLHRLEQALRTATDHARVSDSDWEGLRKEMPFDVDGNVFHKIREFLIADNVKIGEAARNLI